MAETELQQLIRLERWRYRRRVAFLLHVGLFAAVITSAVLFPPWRRPFPVSDELMFIWFVALLVHFGWLRLASARDRAIQRTLEQARDTAQEAAKAAAKRKRADARLALVEDGELVEIVDDESDADQQYRRRD